MALPTTEKFIAATEAELGFSLPEWLRLRLLRENGGTVEAGGEYWELFPVFDTTDRRHIARSTNSIVRETATAHTWPGFPPAAIAIASNGGGDYLVLVPDRSSPRALCSSVHRWQHDTDDEPRPIEVAVGGARSLR